MNLTNVRPLLRVGAITAHAVVVAPASAQLPVWTVTVERRVGPPATEFGAVTDVALDGAGRLWIADGMAGELYVADGDRVHRLASAGRGPGELTPGAVEVVVLAGDTVVVVEPHTRRLHRFGPDLAYVGTRSLTGDAGMTGGWRLLPDGRLAARVYPASVVLPNAPPPMGGDPVLAFAAVGAVGEILALLPETESFRMGAGAMPIITLLAPQPLWDVDDRGRVLVASTHAYEVLAHTGGTSTVVVAEGRAGGSIGRDLEAAARALLRETLARRRTPPAIADRMAADAGMAEAAPVIGGIMAGPGNTIWVRDAATRGEDLVDLEQPGGRTWRIYDEQGRAVGTVTLPSGFQPREWRGDLLAGIGTDELGQTYAVVVMVRRPSG